jgi:hypothetical protein
VQGIEPILEKLAHAQTVFFRAADTIQAENWTAKSKPEEWCAAELVAHLIMVERAIVSGADRVVQKTPKRVPYLKRLHLPAVAGGGARYSQKDADSAGRQPDRAEGRHAGGATRSARTIAGVSERNQEARSERVLLAACLLRSTEHI